MLGTYIPNDPKVVKKSTISIKKTTETAKSVLKAPTTRISSTPAKATTTTIKAMTTPNTTQKITNGSIIKSTQPQTQIPIVKSKSAEDTHKVLKVEINGTSKSPNGTSKVTVKTVSSSLAAKTASTTTAPKKLSEVSNRVTSKSTPNLLKTTNGILKVDTVNNKKELGVKVDAKKILSTTKSKGSPLNVGKKATTAAKILPSKPFISLSSEILTRILRYLTREEKVALRTTCKTLQEVVDSVMISVVKIQGIQLNEAMIANPAALETEIQNVLKLFPKTKGFDFTHWTVNMLMHDEMLKFLPIDLEFLNLAGCRKISDTSFAFMPRNLLYLNLTNCFHVSDEGLKNLPQSLIRLNLTNCFKITDEGIKHVPSNLRYLDVTRCFKVKNPWKSKHEIDREQKRQMKRFLETAKRKKAKESIEMRKLERDIEREEARLREEEQEEQKRKQEELRKAKEDEELRQKAEEERKQKEEEQRILKAQIERKIKVEEERRLKEEERKKKEDEDAKMEEEMKRLEQEILEEERRLKEEEEAERLRRSGSGGESQSEKEDIDLNASQGKESPTSGHGSFDREDGAIEEIQNLRKSSSVDCFLMDKFLTSTEKSMSKLESTEKIFKAEDAIVEQLQALLQRNDKKRSKSATGSAIRMKKNGRVKANFSLEFLKGGKDQPPKLTSSISQPDLGSEELAKEQNYLNSLKSLIEESRMGAGQDTTTVSKTNPSDNKDTTPASVPVSADPTPIEKPAPIERVELPQPILEKKEEKREKQEKKSPIISPKRLSVSDVASMASMKRQQRKMQQMRTRALFKDLREEHLNSQSDSSEQSDQGSTQTGTPGGEKRVRAWKLRMDFYKGLSVPEESPDKKNDVLACDNVPAEPDTTQQMAEILSKLDSLKGQLRSKHSLTKLNSKNSLT